MSNAVGKPQDCEAIALLQSLSLFLETSGLGVWSQRAMRPGHHCRCCDSVEFHCRVSYLFGFAAPPGSCFCDFWLSFVPPKYLESGKLQVWDSFSLPGFWAGTYFFELAVPLLLFPLT
jgi:hypothetical protein